MTPTGCIVALDLESILVPEIWVAVAEATGIAELERTTRDEPDYRRLMEFRLTMTAAHDVDLARLLEVIDALEPLDGARDLLGELQQLGEVVIVSDTFDVFAAPLLHKLGDPAILCHTLHVENGCIVGYGFRTANHKPDAVLALRALGEAVIAVGDSYNDLDMLRAADLGILYRPPPPVRLAARDLLAVDDYDALLGKVRAAVQRFAR